MRVNFGWKDIETTADLCPDSVCFGVEGKKCTDLGLLVAIAGDESSALSCAFLDSSSITYRSSLGKK